MALTVLFIIGFLFFFMMALVGVYMSGYESGRKQMLSDLIDKKVISTDIYVKFLKLLEK
jgi:hypothetical protein